MTAGEGSVGVLLGVVVRARCSTAREVVLSGESEGSGGGLGRNWVWTPSPWPPLIYPALGWVYRIELN